MRRLATFSAALMLVGGCHFHPAPVPVSGDRSSIAELAGNWAGTYRGTVTDRSGSITFTIRASGDSAFGDVLMETPAGVPFLQPTDDPAIHRTHASGPRLLAVKFVHIVGGEVEGALEQYVAPDCDCVVTTKFTGRVQGDTIRGTFTTRGPMLTTQTGVWAVARNK